MGALGEYGQPPYLDGNLNPLDHCEYQTPPTMCSFDIWDTTNTWGIVHGQNIPISTA